MRRLTDNWFQGGYIPVNAGSATRTAPNNLGTFTNNVFSREPGAQSTGGNNIYTFSFDATWDGGGGTYYATVQRNVFEDGVAVSNVRWNG